MRPAPPSARLLSVVALVAVLAGSAAPAVDRPAGSSDPPPGPVASPADNRLLATLAAGLPAADREVPYRGYAYTGVSQEQAELLFADAVAGVYLPELGEVITLVDPSAAPTSMAWAAVASTSLGELPVPAPSTALGSSTIDGFLGELGRRFPALGADDGERFIVKMPTIVHRAARPVAIAGASLPPATAQSIVVAEGFEADPWTRWQRIDNTSGQYTWGTTSCEARSGAFSADGVRGGTAGSSLGCSDLYPNNVENWIDDGQCENFQGAAEAFLDVYTTHNAESGYDRIAFYYPDTTDHYYGVGFSGNSNGWFHVIFNLRQWYSLGDLTGNNCNRLSILFDSDSTNATGFGARLDDLRIQTGPISGMSCSATASPASGAAPLTVNFTGTVTGGTGVTSYSWSFDDGTTSTSQNPSHTYTAAKEYRVSFRASDGIDRCHSYLKVNVTAGGGGGGQWQAGTYSGTTSQGKSISFDVNSTGALTRWSLGYDCSNTSGTLETTTTGCPITNGSFSCGSDSCPSAVTANAKLDGTFPSSTAASGTLAVTVRPAIGMSCCTVTGITWSATHQGGGSGLAASASGSPTSGTAPLAVNFTGSASGGTSPYTWSWNFGDGSSTSTLQNPSHTYASAGTYTATLTVHDATQATATATVTITASGAAAAYRYVVPAIAHNPGALGTMWRTNLAAVNRSASSASLTLTFRSGSTSISRSASLAAGATTEWANILETLFNVDPATGIAGALEIGSNVPLHIAARTFNQTSTGTYGQFYPAITDSTALASGQVGVLPLLKKNSAFRTNVGALNLSNAPTTVLIKLFSASGTQIGSTTSLTLDPYQWAQANDIFPSSGAGNQEIAYATVELQTPSAKAWFYAAVVDNSTGDPTTIVMTR